jgi:lipocalin-like protein
MGRDDSIIGTWKLVSALLTTLGGGPRKLLGENPSGFLTYTSDGRMTAILASSGRQPLSVADPVAAPAEERAEAFASFTAYAGRYTFDGDTLTHHVEVSLFQNWAGTDQIRFARLQGRRLTLTAPPMSIGGEQLVVELTWERN